MGSKISKGLGSFFHAIGVSLLLFIFMSIFVILVNILL